MLPDRSILTGQKLVENAKIQMRHFDWFSNILEEGGKKKLQKNAFTWLRLHSVPQQFYLSCQDNVFTGECTNYRPLKKPMKFLMLVHTVFANQSKSLIFDRHWRNQKTWRFEGDGKKVGNFLRLEWFTFPLWQREILEF